MKIVIYDNTDLVKGYDLIKQIEGNEIFLPSLSYAWRIGARLFRMSNAVDASMGVSSWHDAFKYIGDMAKKYEIEEIQFWGHGSPGRVWIHNSWLNVHNYETYKLINDLRGILGKNKPRWWFRTCSTFAGMKGKKFARTFSKLFDCEVVGHTCIIGTWFSHSYGYGLRPGEDPHWEMGDDLGWSRDDYKSRMVMKNSAPGLTNTVSCFASKVPDSWWANNDNA